MNKMTLVSRVLLGLIFELHSDAGRNARKDGCLYCGFRCQRILLSIFESHRGGLWRVVVGWGLRAPSVGRVGTDRTQHYGGSLYFGPKRCPNGDRVGGPHDLPFLFCSALRQQDSNPISKVNYSGRSNGLGLART
jgi:hypothetical protein